MTNTEFLIVGLLLAILGHVTDISILAILLGILSIIYITVSIFRKEAEL